MNACGLLDPSSVATRIGPVGAGDLQVSESYSDPLPTADPASPPKWPFSARSRCDIRPVDHERAAFRSVSLDLEQYAKEGVVERGSTEQGRSLPGVEGVGRVVSGAGLEPGTRVRFEVVGLHDPAAKVELLPTVVVSEG